MKRMRIVVLCLMALTAAVPMFAAGAKDTGAKQSAEPAKPLVLWVYDAGRIDVLTAIGKKFEAKYGVPVEVSMVDLSQVRNQFLLASGGAECADLAIIPHDNLGALVENAAVEPVNLGSKKASYIAPAIEGFMYNGQLYGVPLAVENIGFFRNTDMVPDAPATWDDVYAIGEKLVKAGKAEVIMGFPDTTYNSFPVFTAFGGAIFGKKADGSWDASKLEIANDGMVKGLEYMTKMVKNKLAPDAVDWDAAHVLFESGKAPFVMTGPWALNRFKEAGVHYAISAFPAATKGGTAGAPFLGVQGVIVSSASKQKMLAQAFAVEFLATEENMKAIYAAEARPSAWKSIFESASDADTKGFNAAGVKAIPMPSIPAMGYVWDAWVSAGSLSFSGEKSAKDALLNAKTQVEEQIKAKK